MSRLVPIVEDSGACAETLQIALEPISGVEDPNLDLGGVRSGGLPGDGPDLFRQLRALEQGADAFFAKPYSPSAVRRKLEQLLC